MPNIEEIFAPYIDLQDPATLRAMLTEIRELQREYGAAWLEHFKAEQPDLVIMVDLAANKTAEEALPLFTEHALRLVDQSGLSGFILAGTRLAVKGWCRSNKAFLIDTHGIIRAEIDRKR